MSSWPSAPDKSGRLSGRFGNSPDIGTFPDNRDVVTCLVHTSLCVSRYYTYTLPLAKHKGALLKESSTVKKRRLGGPRLPAPGRPRRCARQPCAHMAAYVGAGPV